MPHGAPAAIEGMARSGVMAVPRRRRLSGGWRRDRRPGPRPGRRTCPGRRGQRARCGRTASNSGTAATACEPHWPTTVASSGIAGCAPPSSLSSANRRRTAPSIRGLQRMPWCSRALSSSKHPPDGSSPAQPPASAPAVRRRTCRLPRPAAHRSTHGDEIRRDHAGRGRAPARRARMVPPRLPTYPTAAPPERHFGQRHRQRRRTCASASASSPVNTSTCAATAALTASKALP